MYDTILVPTDGSDGARAALGHALDLATTFDATVHTLFVVEQVYAADVGTERILEAMRAEGTRAVEQFAERAEAAGVASVSDVRTGTPHREILDYVEEHDVDLVVMGTHGRTGLDRYLLGSVTEKVVRLSDVPVLTVPRPDVDAA